MRNRYGLAMLGASLLLGTASGAAAETEAAGPRPCEWPGYTCGEGELVCPADASDQVSTHWPIVDGFAYGDKITASFGPRRLNNDPFDYHEGIDIRAQTSLPVHAPWAGTVAQVVAPCIQEGGDDCRSLDHYVVLRHSLGGRTVYTRYHHLEPLDPDPNDGLDDPLINLAIQCGGSGPCATVVNIDAGQAFVYSGNTRNVPYHLHFATTIGGTSARDHAVSPLRMNSLRYLDDSHAEIEFLQFRDSGFMCPESGSDRETIEFLAKSRNATASGPDNRSVKPHLNRVRLVAPTGESLLVDFDQRINDDSPVASGLPSTDPGYEDGCFLAQTSLGFPVAIKMEPEPFDADNDDYKEIRFRVTVPERWKVQDYRKKFEIFACDTWASGDRYDCFPHCNVTFSCEGTMQAPRSEATEAVAGTTGPVCGAPDASVEISSPADGASFPLGQTVTVKATAPLNAVEVRLDVSPGGGPAPDRSAPWEFGWTPTQPGSHLLRAVAFLSSGDIKSSPTVTVSITGTSLPPPSLDEMPTTVFAGVPRTVPVYAPGAVSVSLQITPNHGDGGGPMSYSAATKRWERIWRPAQAGTTYTLTAEASYAGAPQQRATRSVQAISPPSMQIETINRDAFLAKFRDLDLDAPLHNGTYVPTGISSQDYACGVVRYEARGGDIGEHVDYFYDWIPEAIGVFVADFQGSYQLMADINTIHWNRIIGDYDQDRPEVWDVDVLCVSRRVASVRSFFNLGDGVSKDTGIPVSEQVCGIGGFRSHGGDINENDVRDILVMHLDPPNQTWRIRADVTTHHGPRGNEDWQVNLLCLNADVASLGGPALNKPFFLKELPPMGDDVYVSTGVSARDYACGVVGFAARNGDIEEGDHRGKQDNLLLAYLVDNGGTWYFRGDFRTHNDHESWTNVNILCAAREGRTPAPSVLWSLALGGPANDFGDGVAFDGRGDVLLTGLFTGTADLGGPRLTSIGGSQDAFLGKYTGRHGRNVWAKGFGGPSDDIGFRVVVDRRNNDVGLAGWFQGTADFGTGALTSAGSWDVVVGRYSSAGQPLWTSRFGGPGVDGPWGLAIDASGGLFATGYFHETATFGDGASLTSAGLQDVWVAKYAVGGGRERASRFGGPGSDLGLAVGVDGAGNLLTGAVFSGMADFGGGPLTSAGGRDLAVAKYGPSGEHLWSFGFGGAGADQVWDAAVDAQGSWVVAGGFTGQANLGTGPLTSAGGEDIFLAKYSKDGRPLWSRRIGGAGNDRAYAVALDRSGNAVITGYFEGQVDFGAGSHTSAGGRDVFVAMYSGGIGYPLWSSSYGGPGNDASIDVATDAADNIAVTGSFSGGIDFGRGRLAGAGQNDVFLVKLGPAPANRAPRLTLSEDSVQIAPGGFVSVEVSANDADADYLEIRVNALPDGASFSGPGRDPSVPSGIGSARGTFTWSPDETQRGLFGVFFTARDEFGGGETKTLLIIVCEQAGTIRCPL